LSFELVTEIAFDFSIGRFTTFEGVVIDTLGTLGMGFEVNFVGVSVGSD
jgi:hypothetical protein